MGAIFIERKGRLGNIFITFHYRFQLPWIIVSLSKVLLNIQIYIFQSFSELLDLHLEQKARINKCKLFCYNILIQIEFLLN